MGRCQQFKDGKRSGIKFAVAWLHARANEMNDQHAKDILNAAAFNLGVEAKYPPRPMTGIWSTLTEEQRMLALAYNGPVNIGGEGD